MWRPEWAPTTVILVRAPDSFAAHALTESDLAPAREEVRSADAIQILIEDPDGDHRLQLMELGEGGQAAALLPLDDAFRLRAQSAMRFERRLRGLPSGAPPQSWGITRRYRRRLHLMVRALDGHLAEASYREIAEALFGAEAITRYGWKTSSIRGQAIRLVRDAVGMMRGGYRKLLRGD
jgi:hypothetical protein